MTTAPTMHWRVHLARRRPWQAASTGTVILVGAGAAGVGFASAWVGLLAAALLVASVGDYVFPIRYQVSADGITARVLWHSRRLAWAQVRRVIRDELGVRVSPLARRSRLEAYRGIYLWFASNEAEVMATIAHYTRAEAAGGDDQSPVPFLTGAP